MLSHRIAGCEFVSEHPVSIDLIPDIIVKA